MFKLASMAVICSLFSLSTNGWADEDGSFTGYEDIVSELKASADEPLPKTEVTDWDAVALHGGFALATSFLSTTAPNGAAGSGLLKGFELNVGSNLFSRKARGEIAFRSYSPETLSRELSATLREFEARLIFLPLLNDKTIMRMGPGLTSRQLELSSKGTGRNGTFKSSTPSFLLVMGVERKVSKNISVGPDVAYRSPLQRDSIDKSGWDASFRLNATF